MFTTDITTEPPSAQQLHSEAGDNRRPSISTTARLATSSALPRGSISASTSTGAAGAHGVYLLVHRKAQAIKVGHSARRRRVATHVRHGYVVVGHWGGLEERVARRVEHLVTHSWRHRGISSAGAAPVEGRSETAPIEHLASTLCLLIDLLGAPGRAAMPQSSPQGAPPEPSTKVPWTTAHAAALKQLREERGVTFEALSEASGVPKSTIYHMTHPQHAPKHIKGDQIRAVVGVLDV